MVSFGSPENETIAVKGETMLICPKKRDLSIHP